MRCIALIFLFFAFTSSAQEQILVLGNHTKICDKSIMFTQFSESLPKKLSTFNAIFLFSNSTSQLTEVEIEQLIHFTEDGGGLYVGSENWPLQAESKQLTQKMYTKESYGDFNEKNALSAERGNLKLDEINFIPAGETTVAFPMDYRLTVEAWVEDQPLILSGFIGKGRIIIDGGYSRFYCENSTEESEQLLNYFLRFLVP